MSRLKFEIPGEPKSKGRPRFLPRGSHGKVYTPKETINYENLVKVCFMDQVKDRYLIHGCIEAEIYAYVSIPKSVSKKRYQYMLENKDFPTKKPDCDNIAKIILDALNGVAYDDDKQVVNLHVYKRYSDTPRVEVVLREI